jgi:hypothetical protein
MLPAKRLFAWHKAKEALRLAQEEWKRCEETLAQGRERLKETESRLTSLPAPTNPDEEIARLLLEQEVWMAKKEFDDTAAAHQQKSEELKQTILHLQFEVLQLERELDEEYLAAYRRLSETKAQPIAEVRNKSCMGCFLPLSLRKLEEWRRGKGPVFCDECDRLLV